MPLVTTPIGGQGLPDLDTVVSIAPDAATFARDVINLLQDDALWMQRCAAQIGYAEARFTRDGMRESLLAALGMAGSTHVALAA